MYFKKCSILAMRMQLVKTLLYIDMLLPITKDLNNKQLITMPEYALPLKKYHSWQDDKLPRT